MENESALAKNSARVIAENFVFTRAVSFVSSIRFTAFLSLLDGWKSLPMSTCLSPHHVDGEANLRTAQNGGAVSMKILFLYLSKKPSERLSQNDGFIRFFNAKKAPPMCEKKAKVREAIHGSVQHQPRDADGCVHGPFEVSCQIKLLHAWGWTSGSSEAGWTTMGTSNHIPPCNN